MDNLNTCVVLDTSTGEAFPIGKSFTIGGDTYEQIQRKIDTHFACLYFPLFQRDCFKQLKRSEQDAILRILLCAGWKTQYIPYKHKDIAKSSGVKVRTVEDVIPKMLEMDWIIRADSKTEKRYMTNPTVFCKTSGTYKDRLIGMYFQRGGLCYNYIGKDYSSTPFVSFFPAHIDRLLSIKGNNVINFFIFFLSRMGADNRIRTRNHKELQTDCDGNKFGMSRRRFADMVNNMLTADVIRKTLNGYMLNPQIAVKCSLDKKQELCDDYSSLTMED